MTLLGTFVLWQILTKDPGEHILLSRLSVGPWSVHRVEKLDNGCGHRFTREVVSGCRFLQAYGFITIVVQFLLPFVVLLYCYTRIALVLHGRVAKVTRNHNQGDVAKVTRNHNQGDVVKVTGIRARKESPRSSGQEPEKSCQHKVDAKVAETSQERVATATHGHRARGEFRDCSFLFSQAGATLMLRFG